MKISRRGARADHGLSAIEFESPTITWVKSDATLTLRQGDVRDFSTAARHSYTVRLTAAEIGEILSVLAAAAIGDPAQMEKVLEPSLKALLHLQHVAAGLGT